MVLRQKSSAASKNGTDLPRSLSSLQQLVVTPKWLQAALLTSLLSDGEFCSVCQKVSSSLGGAGSLILLRVNILGAELRWIMSAGLPQTETKSAARPERVR